MKRTNSLPLYPVVLTRAYYRENRYLQVLRSTEALNSYLGFSELCKFFFCFMYIIYILFVLFIPLFTLFLFNKSVCSLWSSLRFRFVSALSEFYNEYL